VERTRLAVEDGSGMAMDLLYRVEDQERIVYAVQRGDELFEIDGDIFDGYDAGAPIPGGLDSVRVLAPVVPSKIVAVGLNYKDHAAEQGKPLPGEPLIFLKPSTAVIGPRDAIRLPKGVGRVDHEAEVGVVIRRRAYHVPAERAHEFVLGVTCVNDVTARDIQRREQQYTRPKGFDTFAPVGPAIAVGLDTADLAVEGLVNDQVRQRSSTQQLIFSVPELVAFISGVMTLLPGDIISTGTPAGIGPIVAGDLLTVRVAGVGSLVNPVVDC
jgi:2-keto-4-pentenoate hydratase/2-oxohepta-3-ene-1,7-dioic acid hydratase in catechol pathway